MYLMVLNKHFVNGLRQQLIWGTTLSSIKYMRLSNKIQIDLFDYKLKSIDVPTESVFILFYLYEYNCCYDNYICIQCQYT